MRISDWSSDVCSSDLLKDGRVLRCASTGTSGMGTLSKSEEQHLSDFYEHTGYGSKAIDRAAAEQIAELTGRLETLPDVRALLPLIRSGPDDVPAKTQQIKGALRDEHRQPRPQAGQQWRQARSGQGVDSMHRPAR